MWASIIIGGFVWWSQWRASTWFGIRRLLSWCSWLVGPVLLGWSGSCILDFGIWVLQFSVVVILHVVNSASSVELLSQNFIRVYKSLEFLGKIIILSEKDSWMSVEGIFFSKIVIQVLSLLRISNLFTFNVFFNTIQIAFLILILDIQTSNLSG